MPNLYADAGQFRRTFVGSADLTADDLLGVLRVLETASREVDNYTDRHFYAVLATRYFNGNGSEALPIPDLLHSASTTVKLDEDTDGTYELTLTDPADYWPERSGYLDRDADPTTTLRLNRYEGSRGAFLRRPRLVEIAGEWGFTAAVERVASVNKSDPLAAGAVTMNVTTDTGTELFAPGQTLLLGDEQIYVSAIANDALTIVRGVNGTTDAAHVVDTVIDRYVYVPEVAEAALVMAGQLWKERESSFVSEVIQAPGIGSISIGGRRHPAFMTLLTSFRKVGF